MKLVFFSRYFDWLVAHAETSFYVVGPFLLSFVLTVFFENKLLLIIHLGVINQLSQLILKDLFGSSLGLES